MVFIPDWSTTRRSVSFPKSIMKTCAVTVWFQIQLLRGVVPNFPNCSFHAGFDYYALIAIVNFTFIGFCKFHGAYSEISAVSFCRWCVSPDGSSTSRIQLLRDVSGGTALFANTARIVWRLLYFCPLIDYQRLITGCSILT